MAARAFERSGSRDGDGQTRTFKYIVIEAADEIEAVDVADAAAPALYLGVPKGFPSHQHQGGGVYYVDVVYTNRTNADGAAGQPPPPQGGSEGGGNPSPPESGSTPVGPELSFTLGGGTKKIIVSNKTVFKTGRNEAGAPSFKGLIGVGKDGAVEGAEVPARTAEFSLTYKFTGLTVGYIMRMFATVGTTNLKPFRGMASEEGWFLGGDGRQDPNDKKFPWTITGKFRYERNWTEAELDNFEKATEIRLPEKKGTHWLWTYNEDTTENANVGGITYPVSRPKWAFVEQLVEPVDWKVLGMS